MAMAQSLPSGTENSTGKPTPVARYSASPDALGARMVVNRDAEILHPQSRKGATAQAPHPSQRRRARNRRQQRQVTRRREALLI